MTSITITLPKKEKVRLARIAGKHGLSLSELSRHALSELTENIPIEFITDYENPISLKMSLRRAFRDLKAGRVKTTL